MNSGLLKSGSGLFGAKSRQGFHASASIANRAFWNCVILGGFRMWSGPIGLHCPGTGSPQANKQQDCCGAEPDTDTCPVTVYAP